MGRVPEGRWANGFLADYVARRGIVALIYDKRGVGESTGDWKTSTLDDLARDATRRCSFARGPSRRRRSTCAASTATARAASSRRWWRPATTTCDGSSTRTATSGRSTNRTSTASRRCWRSDTRARTCDDALSLYGEFVDVARGGLARDQLHADAAKHRSAAWYDALGLPDDQDWIWAWYRGVGNADNRRAWAAIGVPVLLLYGERDDVVPPRKSIDAIAGLLKRNHDTAVTVRVLGGADHALRVPPADALGWPRYADGFPALIVDWINGVGR